MKNPIKKPKLNKKQLYMLLIILTVAGAIGLYLLKNKKKYCNFKLVEHETDNLAIFDDNHELAESLNKCKLKPKDLKKEATAIAEDSSSGSIPIYALWNPHKKSWEPSDIMGDCKYYVESCEKEHEKDQEKKDH